MSRVATAIACVCVCACGDGGAALPDAARGDEVTGVARVLYVVNDVETPAPIDLSAVIIAAHVREADTWRTLPGTGTADGTFTISGVPSGEYTLQVGDEYLVTSARAVDLSRYALGRADRETVSAGTSGLAVDVTGLEPWQAADDLELYSAEAGALAFLLGALPDGATAATGASLHLSGPLFPRIDAARGDGAWLTQLHTVTAIDGGPTRTYTTIVKAAAAPPFTLAAGATVTIMASLMSPAMARSTTLRWQRAALSATLPALNPAGEDCGDSLYLYAQPGGTARGDLGVRPRLARLLDAPPDVLEATYELGDPFPANWGRFAVASAACWVPLAGGSPAQRVTSGLAVKTPLLDITTLAPTQDPVVAPLLDGADAFAARAAVGETPTLSWGAPALGPTDQVAVTIYRWSGGVPVASWVVRTHGDHVTIPPGILAPGFAYHAAIDAQAGVDPGRPLVTRLPYASAVLVVGLFTP